MSRIDRFLISHDWLTCWPDSTQLVLDREFSDHCPLLLRNSGHDWGPKPFRVLNCWLKDHRFKPFVEKTWEENVVHGRGDYMMKEKLKALKAKIRIWNKEVFGDVNKQGQVIVEEMARLDKKNEEHGLTEEEHARSKELYGEYWSVARNQNQLCKSIQLLNVLC